LVEEHDARVVQVVHDSPGRLRLRVVRAALEDGTWSRAERALTGLAGVQQVRSNALASSLVVHYDDGVVGVSVLLDALARAGLTVVNSSLPPAPPPAGGRSRVARSIESFFGSADGEVTRLTNGTADLRTLVPLGLGALALREILAGRVGAAPWYTLAWWAFDSFLKLQEPRAPQRPPAR
jgi:hypothetical protein